MSVVSANDLAKTYFCKSPGCEQEARSPVGRYSYCSEHQGTATAKPRVIRAVPDGSESGTEKALRDLLSLAKQVDRAKAKADKLQGAANAANREADTLEKEYRDALATAARGVTA